MKKSITLVSLLLICTIAFSTTPLTLGNYASASTNVGAANFLPNVSYPDYFDTTYETSLSLSTAQYIKTELGKLCGAYPNHSFYRYESSCTFSDYQSVLNTIKTTNDQAIVFSKGHRTVLNVNGNNHWGIIPWPGTSYIDYQIYSSTTTDNILTFIWHCQTADNYSGNGTIPKYSDNTYYGLPYCFTHNPSMQKYGSSGSQVYLGWTDKNYTITWVNGTITYTGAGTAYPHGIGSPQYEWEINSNFKFCQVAGLYWYYMCDKGYQTQSALDSLSMDVYGTRNFYNTEVCV